MGGAVLYKDLSQSSELRRCSTSVSDSDVTKTGTPVPLPPNYNILYPLFIYISIYSYMFSLKSFKCTFMGMKIFENTFPSYEDLQILGMLFTSHLNPHTTLGNE